MISETQVDQILDCIVVGTPRHKVNHLLDWRIPRVQTGDFTVYSPSPNVRLEIAFDQHGGENGPFNRVLLPVRVFTWSA